MTSCVVSVVDEGSVYMSNLYGPSVWLGIVTVHTLATHSTGSSSGDTLSQSCPSYERAAGRTLQS